MSPTNLTMVKACLLAVPALMLLASPGRADCNYPGYEFFPEKNGGVVVDMKVTDGAPCTHRFAEGPGYKFTSVGIDRMPEHGALKRDGTNRFVYRPAAGFTGKDFYGMKVCAIKGGAKGCTVIYYVATVE
jgi:hypothetical protein